MLHTITMTLHDIYTIFNILIYYNLSNLDFIHKLNDEHDNQTMYAKFDILLYIITDEF